MRAILSFIIRVLLQSKGFDCRRARLVVFHLSSTIIRLLLINLSQTVDVTVQFNGQTEQGRAQISHW